MCVQPSYNVFHYERNVLTVLKRLVVNIVIGEHLFIPVSNLLEEILYGGIADHRVETTRDNQGGRGHSPEDVLRFEGTHCLIVLQDVVGRHLVP